MGAGTLVNKRGKPEQNNKEGLFSVMSCVRANECGGNGCSEAESTG